MNEIESKVLEAYIRHELVLSPYVLPTSQKSIASIVQVSKYAVRKAVSGLVQGGYLKKVTAFNEADDEYYGYPVIGFTITEKAVDTPEFERAVDREARSEEECFNIPFEEAKKAIMYGYKKTEE